MHIQFFRHIVFNGVEEIAKLLGAMPALHLSDDLAGLCVLGSTLTAADRGPRLSNRALGASSGQNGYRQRASKPALPEEAGGEFRS
jgi:hypothetical protein